MEVKVVMEMGAVMEMEVVIGMVMGMEKGI